ncbi:MAG: hypothetical protein ACI9EB_000569 [Pseudomonas sp.]
MMFEIKPQDPETYRSQTRRSTLIIAVMFAALAMLLSTAAVMWFGEPGGDNFRLNVAGVVAGLLVSIALLRLKLSPQPWMAAAIYGWQLKRSLMRVTNIMHHVTAGVAAGDPAAMDLLRFYHLGLTQMHQLDANSSALSQEMRDIDQHKARMTAQGMDTEIYRLDPAWLTAVKKAAGVK